MLSIQEKINCLSPEALIAVEDFLDELLSQENYPQNRLLLNFMGADQGGFQSLADVENFIRQERSR
jgi:hypothetical protein